MAASAELKFGKWAPTYNSKNTHYDLFVKDNSGGKNVSCENSEEWETIKHKKHNMKKTLKLGFG